MKELLKQLLNKLVGYFLFMIVMSFIFVCLMAGEFPPKLSTIKSQYQSLSELKSNYALVMKNAAERLKNADSAAPNNANSENDVVQKQVEKALNSNQMVLDEIKDFRLDQARMAVRIQNIEEQNKALIRLLESQKNK